MRLLEDEDGAPLPDSLQFESPLWSVVYDVMRAHHDTTESIEKTDRCMIKFAKILQGDED